MCNCSKCLNRHWCDVPDNGCKADCEGFVEEGK